MAQGKEMERQKKKGFNPKGKNSQNDENHTIFHPSIKDQTKDRIFVGGEGNSLRKKEGEGYRVIMESLDRALMGRESAEKKKEPKKKKKKNKTKTPPTQNTTNTPQQTQEQEEKKKKKTQDNKKKKKNTKKNNHHNWYKCS